MEWPGGWTYRTALNVLRRRGRRARVEARLMRRRSRQGNVTIDDYRMPPANYGCWEPDQCALQWLPGEAVPSPFSTPFEIVGP
jgi:hypothetical protein